MSNKSERKMRRALLTVTAMLLATMPSTAAIDPAAAFVQKAAAEAIIILQRPSVAEAQRKSDFKAVLLRQFDSLAVAQFVTGPYWATASSAQQKRFEAIFENALARIYTDRFFDYDGNSVQIKSTHPSAGGTTIVQTLVSSPSGGKTYDVDWVVSSGTGTAKLIDVVIDGVSTSMTTKQDYGSFLRTASGNLDALSAALERKEAQ